MNDYKNNLSSQGNYLTASRYKDIVFTAGMTPRKNGKLIQTGKVDSKKEKSFYKDSLELSTMNALIAIDNVISENENIYKILSLIIYINTDAYLESHASLADYASMFLYKKIGSIGARTTVGVASLPGNSPVEVRLIASLC